MKKKLIGLFMAMVMLCSMMPTAFAASDEATAAANELYSMGLFNGTGTDANGNPSFDLDRTPNRHEAVTMLVRLLGKEAEAKAGTWDIPFTDVAEWAKPYVGYAYAHGLTSGTSATTYSGNNTVTASQYITFVLRALGYDSSTDFQWNKAWELSDKIGLTNGEYNEKTTHFTRGDLAIISYKSLSAPKKDTQVDTAVTSSDLQGYWYNETISGDQSKVIECFYFTGDNYSHVGRIFDSANNVTDTIYETGTFSSSDGILYLTRTESYWYLESTRYMDSNTNKRTDEFSVSKSEKGLLVNGKQLFTRSEQAAGLCYEVKNYIMERKGPAPINSADYAYLASSDFRAIRNTYPHAVAQCAYVYAYTDLNGDLCVLTDVRYELIKNWSEFTLHNLTTGTKITNPDDYYENLADRSYGATRTHYQKLQSEVLGHYFKMMNAMSSVLKGNANTYDGVFVDAKTLNL